jgi:glycosidase
MTSKQHWWQKTTIYQIYPRSFADSDDDGIGDLRGIISKLDHIQDLGFETIWVSPFFRSPQQDWGYDVSDYYSVAPEYGDAADTDELIDVVHQRGMRILFDLVMNHTSIQHPWFQESRSSRDNPKRDWYIWKDSRGQRPPNNWKAIPGGSAWHYDEGTEQWYYASFLPFQPDLNFHNPDVKEEMLDVVRYWLNKGVDGFRLDIFHVIYEDAQFRDNPFAPVYVPSDHVTAGFFQKWKYNLNQPETLELSRELRAIANAYSPDRLLLGELFGDDDTIRRYLGEQQDGLNLVFLWKLLQLEPNARFFRDVIRHYEANYPAPYIPVYVFGNHDQKRLISKISNDTRKAKLLALFQFTVRGIPVTYYGEEIGMAEGRLSAKTAKDPLGRRYAWIPDFLVDLLNPYVNRDGCRTPMQWDASPNAGFCGQDTTPWLPVHENHETVNVESERANEGSLLNVYRQLLRLRRGSAVLQEGTIQLLDEVDVDENVLAYRRILDGEEILLAINFGQTSGEFYNRTACKQILFEIGLNAVSPPPNLPHHGGRNQMPPYSGVILGK